MKEFYIVYGCGILTGFWIVAMITALLIVI